MKMMTLHLNNRKLWAIVPAAGSGSRFSKTSLKQYQMIQGKTVLEHTVSRLNQLPLAGYVLAVSEQDHIVKTLDFKNKEKAHYCLGGKERVNSVLNALKYLAEIADPNDIVFVHDAARPCVTIECLEDLIKSITDDSSIDSAILAIPVRDTLKFVTLDYQIEHTVSRDQLWQAQTPQVSTLLKLKNAIEQSLENNILITDEASALEHVGESVKVVLGRADNLKITYADDLELAKLILSAQKSEDC